MNKDFRNLGTAIAISTLTEGLSLAKIYLPIINRYMYALSSKNGEINYSIDIEKDINNLDSDQLLQDVLNYANKEFGGEEKLDFSNTKECYESIAKVINTFRSKTEKIFEEYRDIADEKERLAHPNKVILQNILKRINYVDNDLYTFSEVESNEYSVLNLTLDLIDFICGEYGLDAEVLDRCADGEDIEEIYKDHSHFMNELNDYFKKNEKRPSTSIEAEEIFTEGIRRMMELSNRFETEQDLPWDNSNDDTDTEDEENDEYDYSDDEYPDYEDDCEDLEKGDDELENDYDANEVNFLINTIKKNFGISSTEFLMHMAEKNYELYGKKNYPTTEDKLKLLFHTLQGDELDEEPDDKDDGIEPADNI